MAQHVHISYWCVWEKRIKSVVAQTKKGLEVSIDFTRYLYCRKYSETKKGLKTQPKRAITITIIWSLNKNVFFWKRAYYTTIDSTILRKLYSFLYCFKLFTSHILPSPFCFFFWFCAAASSSNNRTWIIRDCFVSHHRSARSWNSSHESGIDEKQRTEEEKEEENNNSADAAGNTEDTESTGTLLWF